MTINYPCPECQCDIEFEFIEATPDVYYLRNGDPGYPGSAAEADGPEECPECGTELDLDKVIEHCSEVAADRAQDYPDREDE